MKIYKKPSLKIITSKQKKFIEKMKINPSLSLKKNLKRIGLKIVFKKKLNAGGKFDFIHSKIIVKKKYKNKKFLYEIIPHELGHFVQYKIDNKVFQRPRKLSDEIKIEQQAESMSKLLIFKKFFPNGKQKHIAYFNKKDFKFLAKYYKKYVKNDLPKILKVFKK